MKRLVYIIMYLCVFVSCANHRDYKEALTRAQNVIEERPDSSLAILDTLGIHYDEFGNHFRMQYLLTLTYAQAKTGVLFKTDSLTKLLVNHFDRNGSCREKALAYYMNGCALSDIGQAPEALQSFYDAIDRADTTRTDCDYNVLKGIYGQMSRIFHQQNLPQDEIWALKHYLDYVRRIMGEEAFVIAKLQMIRPYYLLNEKDSVLKITNDTYQILYRLGNKQRAAGALVASIYIYTERGQIHEAAKALRIFEQESGLFDKEGNIAAGREGYYFIKGFYEQKIKNNDTAEFYFRKAIRYGYLSEGYRGLLNIYREKNDIDSVLLFSELYECAQDSLHNKMQTDVIHQMSALYNYSRSQKEAEIARDNARKNRLLSISIAIVAVMTLWGLFLYYRNSSQKKRQMIAELESDLKKAKDTRREIFDELQQLKAQNYEEIIASKERQLAELAKTIEQLQAENEAFKDGSVVRETDNLDQFINSSIANLFIKKATEKTEKVQPTEAEWKMLTSEFSKDNPATYKSFGEGRPLSKLELRICILLVLDIPEYVITLMTNSSPSTISNSKARANEKLYGKKDAHPLKINLIHSLKAV